MFSIWWTWRLQFPASPHPNVQTIQSHHPVIPEIVTITDLLELYIYHRHIVIYMPMVYTKTREFTSSYIGKHTWIKKCASINNIGKMWNRFQFFLKISKLLERKPHNKNSGKKLCCTALFPHFFIRECKCQWCWVDLRNADLKAGVRLCHIFIR